MGKVVRDCSISFGSHPTCPGSNIKTQYRWNETHSAIVKVGEIDVQKKIDEAARGMSITEQVARMLRGDASVLSTDEPIYGDLTGYADMTREQMLAVVRKPLDDFAEAAQNRGMYVEELEQEVMALTEKLDALKNLNVAKQTEKVEESK